MRAAACLIAALVVGCSSPAYGQGGDPKDTLQQTLKGQFALTRLNSDKSDIVSTGAVLVLQKGGLLMYSTASPLPSMNTYKNGKISQGGSGFGRDLLITMASGGNSTPSDYPQRQFSAGEKLWVTGLAVQKGGIVFNLYSDPYDDVRYYGQLKLPFEKGSIPSPDQALARIAEVLTVQPPDNSADNAPSDQAPAQQNSLYGMYFLQDTGAHLQLNPDDSFSLQGGDGVVRPGHFTVNGNTLVLTYAATGRSSSFTIQGDKFYADSGKAWVRQGDASAPPVPAVAPLKLPSIFVSAQNPTDQLKLNTDNSFALQEGGQPYHGTFVTNGDSLELNISETSSKTTVTRQGSNLTDSSGQTWVLKDQRDGGPPRVETATLLPRTDAAGTVDRPAADCNDYGSCMAAARTALGASQWDVSIATFQRASTFDASKPEAWAGMGSADLGSGRKEEAATMWDKTLNLGGPLTFVVCRPGFGGSCQSDRSDRGNLSLEPKLVSFVTSSGKTVFSVSPSAVSSAEVSHQRTPIERNELRLKISGKNYTFYFVPLGIDCGKEESAYCEEDEAIAQQLAVFNYISQAVPKLVSGALGSSRP